MELERVFGVVVCHVDGRPLVKVNGDVDAASSPTLREALRALVDVGEREVRVDLSGVTFMDSTGIGVLLDVLRADAVLVLVGASRQVRRVLEITGLSALDNLRQELAPTEP